MYRHFVAFWPALVSFRPSPFPLPSLPCFFQPSPHGHQPINTTNSYTTSRQHQPKRSHQLRYVLRNRATGQVYLVVLFTLLLAEDVNDDGTLKPGALGTEIHPLGEESLPGTEEELELEPDEEDFGEDEALGEARRKLAGVKVGGDGSEEDDVD